MSKDEASDWIDEVRNYVELAALEPFVPVTAATLGALGARSGALVLFQSRSVGSNRNKALVESRTNRAESDFTHFLRGSDAAIDWALTEIETSLTGMSPLNMRCGSCTPGLHLSALFSRRDTLIALEASTNQTMHPSRAFVNLCQLRTEEVVSRHSRDSPVGLE